MADKKDKKEEGGAEGEGTAAPRSKKKLIIAAAALLVVGGGAGGGWFFFLKKLHRGSPDRRQGYPLVFFDLPDLLVNLTTPAGDTRRAFSRPKWCWKSPTRRFPTRSPIMPRDGRIPDVPARDASKDLEAFRLYRLRDEPTRRVNLAVAPNKVNAVLFKEIIVQ